MRKNRGLVVALALLAAPAMVVVHVNALEKDLVDESQSFWPKAQRVAQVKAEEGVKLLEKGTEKAARRAKTIFEEVAAA